MNRKVFKTFILLTVWTLCAHAQQQSLDISGTWKVMLDHDYDQTANSDSNNKMEGMIQLPSSLAEQGYGIRTKGADFGILTPEYKYLGLATYERGIVIPETWKNKVITIFLERVLWQSKVYIDGKELSTQDALGTPHIHQIGKLSPGKHSLIVKVDNRMMHNIGDKGHAYGEYTQSIWNGIVGKMEIRAQDPTHIRNIRTFSLMDVDRLKVELELTASKAEKSEITFQINQHGKAGIVKELSVTKKLVEGINKLEVPIQLEGKLKTWNEFEPTVYILKTFLKTKKYTDTHELEFGHVNIGHNGTQITINDKPVFLRGNLDCVHFPLTGYPSTKVEDWERIFRVYKEYGLNHARFHSWCPPEAAFKAANRVGIYLQAEASIWIDWWMSEDMKVRGRPEMDTRGHPKGLGHDPVRDAFVVEEMNRVVDFYGNNPSFTMFCIGNELGNSDFDITKKWVADLKKRDPKRLYAVSTARKITEVDDYSATHYISDVGRTRGLNGPHTDWDFEDVYSKMDIPIIAHEIGQWPVYPSWKEIDKYTGVLKARNLEEFKAQAEKNGIAHQAEDFRRASGALNQIMYKYEIESFLRTKSCAGIQLLSMQDYQGQGEALIGWLDAHWESKGITTPKKFKQHFDETVPLLRIKKFIWNSNETLEATAQLSHYGQSEIADGTIVADVVDNHGRVVHQQEWSIKSVPVGSLTELGKLSLPLYPIKKARQLTISLTLKNTRFKNEWKIWVYPHDLPNINTEDIKIADEIDNETLRTLEQGGKVLLVANHLGTQANSVSVDYYPLYWSLTFFPGQGKTNLGMLIRDKHPALAHFPTSYHSDWQWEPFGKHTKAFLLNDMPSYRPIVQAVDDFHRNNKEGILFEFRVGKGKLLISGFDLELSSPVARQLKHSLIQYMLSDDFMPDREISIRDLKNRFMLISRPTMGPEQASDKTLLHVKASKAAGINDKQQSWARQKDKVQIKKHGTDYTVANSKIYVGEKRTGWQGENMTVTINCPNGILGSLYVRFDTDNETQVIFEGRKVKIGTQKQGERKWIKFHVMREDSNDGQLQLKSVSAPGTKLIISEIMLNRE
ncbi:MAG: hypothetical protein MI975_06770 [Cytophagales bacterium]|nr:hypothetical protein [Cytophagales bacterium]